MAAKVNKKIQHRIFLHCDKYLRQFHFIYYSAYLLARIQPLQVCICTTSALRHEDYNMNFKLAYFSMIVLSIISHLALLSAFLLSLALCIVFLVIFVHIKSMPEFFYVLEHFVSRGKRRLADIALECACCRFLASCTRFFISFRRVFVVINSASRLYIAARFL